VASNGSTAAACGADFARFPATEALHDAARFARRAQRLLGELEPERLDEFEADLDLLSDAVADLRLVLDQRRGRRPPPAQHGSEG
jgi:hypothetical protein